MPQILKIPQTPKGSKVAQSIFFVQDPCLPQSSFKNIIISCHVSEFTGSLPYLQACILRPSHCLFTRMKDGLCSMLILQTCTELQVRDAAIGADCEEGPHERGNKIQDACLHRVGKTLKTNKANTLQSTTCNLYSLQRLYLIIHKTFEELCSLQPLVYNKDLGAFKAPPKDM